MAASSSTDDLISRVKRWHVFAAFIGVLGLWGVAWLLTVVGPFCGWEQRSQFGAMFGSVEALFSGFAFAGIILTILLQRDELQLQRKDLALTRDELRGQKEQMEGQKEQLERQNETLRQQQFEGVFFQLLRLHHEIVNAMVTKKRAHNTGRECFDEAYKAFASLYAHFHRQPQLSTQIDQVAEPDVLKVIWDRFFPEYEPVLGHYFRNLYNLVKLVDRSDVSDKKQYTNLIRAQLSQYEVLVLFYNGLSDRGRPKFKPLIEQYGLLKHIAQSEVIQQTHLDLYSDDAYAGTRVHDEAKG